ncbi:MAG: bacteriohemerythrin, partial [Bdellovibrionales bacterium]|nr:bacteriohemerythrin [Bdellovibrionales bacterium]
MQSLILKNNEGFYTKSYKQMSLLNMLLWIILSASVLFSLIISVTISNTTIKKLDSIAESVSDTTTAIGFSISQLLSSSEELSSAVAEEASAIQETASSVEEISSMVEKTAKNAEESNKVSQGSKEKAEKGQIIMNELSSAIQKISSNNEAIATEVSASNERINEIIAVIEEIGVKTKVINDIVFQTKLLSFNASVEAARAGDNGKGFAVVAEEVGNLAEMSGNAAKEITTMLDSSMDKVEAIADESKRKIQTLVDQAVDTVQKGSRIANNFTEILSDVVRDSQLASSLSQDINNANKEQAYGVREVSKAINLLNESTQTNASVAQTNESATESLKSLSNDLREASSGLKSFILGKISVPRFIWKDEYALNVSQMDAEHKVLIQKINNLAAVIEANSGKNNSKVLNAFDELATYTVKHFSDEEVFQASINYPHLEAHKEIHRRLLNSVKKYRTDLETGDYNLSELMRFLNDWLVSHILNVDMKYSKFFQQQNKVG